MPFTIFIATYTIMLLAEFGDKTQLVALSIMSRTKKPFTVALGATIGITLTTIVGIAIAALISKNIDPYITRIVAGSLFLLLGLLTFKEALNHEGEGQQEKPTIKNPFLSAISFVAIAELGDKSQLFVIAQSLSGNFWEVFFGAILGMATILFLTAIIGDALIKKVPEKYLKFIAATLFVMAGLFIFLT